MSRVGQVWETFGPYSSRTQLLLVVRVERALATAPLTRYACLDLESGETYVRWEEPGKPWELRADLRRVGQ